MIINHHVRCLEQRDRWLADHDGIDEGVIMPPCTCKDQPTEDELNELLEFP